MTDDRVIDIRRYLGPVPDRGEPGAFGVWGGAGERSRFALPVWRAIYLAGGNWGGVVFTPEDGSVGSPFFVLDLGADPARTEMPSLPLAEARNETAPAILQAAENGLAILLGSSEERRWFLLIQGEGRVEAPDGKDLETLLFLAGECSGLLFLRELEKVLPTKE